MEFDQCLQSLREELAACCGVQNLDMIPWSWVANAACQILTAHSSGLARTVLLTELEAQWHQAESQEILQTETYRTVEPFLRRATTKPPPSTVFNLRINQSAEIPNTNIRLWKVAGAPDPLNIGDARKGGAGPKRLKTADMQLDMFVHQRYYPMIESREFSDFFRHQRTFFVTGLMLADRAGGSHGEPIHTFLPTTSLAFELHIKDNPNLAPALRRHTDEQLLRDVFGVQYSDAKFVQCSKPILNVDQLWCKVDNISSVEHKYRNKIIVQCLTMECVLEHKPRSVTLSIEFYENDVSVARLFRQDDYIGLLCPLIKPANEAGESVTVEYGPDTIAFIMRGIRERVDSMRSQMTIQANEFGFLDYRRYAHRLQICQLQPDMIHLTMMARVQGVSENVPTKDGDGRLIDRYSS
ncbi:hypothetical protein GGI12_001282 [Dipsacomyces acuminosporus]|nr:hypothetical protein GGI12_001282 [Dipsacomyces acuminosporus]